MFRNLRNFNVGLVLLFAFASLLGCRAGRFPDYPENYREYAYITDGAANTVTVLDLVYLRPDRVLQVGQSPTGLAANPVRNEVYVVNSGSGSISVISTETNKVVATIPVHRQPYFISVAPDGRRAYVANSGSNSVSVLDLDARLEIAVAGAGEQPGLARISPDGRSLIVTNRGSGSVSVFAVSTAQGQPPLKLRTAFPGCPGATDAVAISNPQKAFIACSGTHQVMVLSLAAAPDSWEAKQDAKALTDRLLTFLDVGKTPAHLALKPDGGEVFVSNFDSDSISEISTWTNEVSSTFTIGTKPTHSVISGDNSTLWVSNFGADSVSRYSIDDGHLITTGGNSNTATACCHTGPEPDAMAFSADEHLLLVASAQTGDVAVIHTNAKNGPQLFTMLPGGRTPNDMVTKAFTVGH